MKLLLLIERKHGVLASLVLGALLLSACGGSGGDSAADTVHSDAVKPPAVHVPSGAPPKNVVIKDLARGNGAAVPPISDQPLVKIRALYKAVRYKNGELYETQWDPDNPFEIEFGPNLEVEGWEKGMVGMRVGGRRELIVPSRMAYKEGALVYVIDLLGVKKIHPSNSKDGQVSPEGQGGSQKQGLLMSKEEITKLPKLTITKQSGPPPRQIKVIDLRHGSGATVTSKDSVFVRYLVSSYPAALLRSRTGLSEQRSFGLDETVRGWTVGLPGMKVGGRRELILPPKLVYPRWKPSWGYAPYVDIYVIDLLGINQGDR